MSSKNTVAKTITDCQCIRNSAFILRNSVCNVILSDNIETAWKLAVFEYEKNIEYRTTNDIGSESGVPGSGGNEIFVGEIEGEKSPWPKNIKKLFLWVYCLKNPITIQNNTVREGIHLSGNYLSIDWMFGFLIVKRYNNIFLKCSPTCLLLF